MNITNDDIIISAAGVPVFISGMSSEHNPTKVVGALMVTYPLTKRVFVHAKWLARGIAYGIPIATAYKIYKKWNGGSRERLSKFIKGLTKDFKNLTNNINYKKLATTAGIAIGTTASVAIGTTAGVTLINKISDREIEDQLSRENRTQDDDSDPELIKRIRNSVMTFSSRSGTVTAVVEPIDQPFIYQRRPTVVKTRELFGIESTQVHESIVEDIKKLYTAPDLYTNEGEVNKDTLISILTAIVAQQLEDYSVDLQKQIIEIEKFIKENGLSQEYFNKEVKKLMLSTIISDERIIIDSVSSEIKTQFNISSGKIIDLIRRAFKRFKSFETYTPQPKTIQPAIEFNDLVVEEEELQQLDEELTRIIPVPDISILSSNQTEQIVRPAESMSEIIRRLQPSQ